MKQCGYRRAIVVWQERNHRCLSLIPHSHIGQIYLLYNNHNTYMDILKEGEINSSSIRLGPKRERERGFLLLGFGVIGPQRILNILWHVTMIFLLFFYVIRCFWQNMPKWLKSELSHNGFDSSSKQLSVPINIGFRFAVYSQNKIVFWRTQFYLVSIK